MREKLKAFGKIFLMLTLLIYFLIGCSSNTVKNKKITVGVTIFPFYDAVKNIGKDKVEVTLILEAGSSPHDYTIKPEDIIKLQGTKIIFYNDFGLDDWAIKIATETKAKTINVSENLQNIFEKNDNNPHFWLSPELFIKQCLVISEELASLDPQNASFYEQNYNEYVDEILQNGELLKEEVQKLQNRNLITFHDAFSYFADYFGLNIVGVIETSPGEMPTPKRIQQIEETIKALGIKSVYKEPQQSSEIYKALVEDTNVQIVTLDPIGDNKNITSYNELIKYNVRNIIYGQTAE